MTADGVFQTMAGAVEGGEVGRGVGVARAMVTVRVTLVREAWRAQAPQVVRVATTVVRVVTVAVAMMVAIVAAGADSGTAPILVDRATKGGTKVTVVGCTCQRLGSRLCGRGGHLQEDVTQPA